MCVLSATWLLLPFKSKHVEILGQILSLRKEHFPLGRSVRIAKCIFLTRRVRKNDLFAYGPGGGVFLLFFLPLSLVLSAHAAFFAQHTDRHH